MDFGRRQILGAACGVTASALVDANPQPAGRIHRVVFPFDMSAAGRENVRKMLAEHGFEVGRNLTLEFVPVADPTEGHGVAARLPAAEQERRARQIVTSRPDAIVMPGFIEVSIFQRMTREIPIVFYHYAGDPVQAGWVESLRRPGANLTGTIFNRVEMIPKHWSLLKELRPDARRGGMLMTEEYAAEGAHWSLVREIHASSAPRLGLTIVELPFPASASFDVVKALLRRQSVDLLVVALKPEWPSMASLLQYLITLRVPALYAWTSIVREGGLLSHSPDFREGARVAMAIVARILRGESPATMPVHQINKHHVAINLRTAKAMGLEVPGAVLLQADEVFDG